MRGGRKRKLRAQVRGFPFDSSNLLTYSFAFVALLGYIYLPCSSLHTQPCPPRPLKLSGPLAPPSVSPAV